MEENTINLLRHIRDNPFCRSNPTMDGFAIKELIQHGYINGTDITSDDSNGTPEFMGLQITPSGRRAIAQYEQPNNKPRSKGNQEQSAIKQIAIHATGGTLIILIGYALYHYLGISIP